MENKTRLNIVVFTGAGISAESGLSTFRDTNGLWKQYDAQKLASVAGFEENPQAVLDFYNARRKRLLEVEPNHAHLVLSKLEQLHEVTIITQNVDDLHERAGSSHVIHLHGELTKVTSSRNRLDPDNIEVYPLDRPIRLGDKAKDGSQLRPFIVWFGETLDNLEEVVALISCADIFVVVGTSLKVNPVAALVHFAKPGARKYLIDPSDMQGRLPMDFKHIKKGATEGIDMLMEDIKNL